MKLLLKRSQTLSSVPGVLAIFRRPVFKLWVKLEFEDDEQRLVSTYRFADSMLIEAVQPTLIRNAAILGVATFVVTYLLFGRSGFFGILLTFIAGGGAGWYYFDRMRETIYVRDLISGRHIDCRSVVALAKKEAFFGYATAVLRQVMETAKHWDGTEIRQIDALGVEEAKYVALRSL